MKLGGPRKLQWLNKIEHVESFLDGNLFWYVLVEKPQSQVLKCWQNLLESNKFLQK